MCVDVFRLGGTGGWSSKGCEVLNRNNSHISCQCNHMTSFAVLMDISKREVLPTKKLPFSFILFNVQPCYELLTGRLTAAWQRSPPEDRHLHHGVGLPVPPPPHLDLVVPPAPAPLQPPRHPQEPGSSSVLLRACLPAGHQSDRQPGKCISSL